MTRTVLMREEASDESNVLEDAFVDLEHPDFELFWMARVWKFRHTNPATPVVTLNWHFALPTGKFSTDRKFYVLLESFKTVVWGMLSNEAYGKRLSVGTLTSISSGVREAFRWFVWKNINDFSRITPAVQQQFLDVLPKLILAKDEVYPGFVAEGQFGHAVKAVEPEFADDEEGDDPQTEGELMLEDGGFSYSQVANRLAVFYYIRAQRKLLKERGLPVFTQPPFDGKSFGEQTRSLAEWVIKRIPALPPAVSVPLLHEVVRWVDEVGAKVARAHRAYQSAVASRRRKLLTAAFSELDEAGFGEQTLALIPWRERFEEGGNALGDPVGLDHHRMRLALLMYRDACVLALQYLAGLRISEVCSPQVLKRKEHGLASCLYKRESPDGLMDLYFLKGLLVKGRQRPVEKDWVIGCVPRGSKELPVVVRALNQLHDVFSPFYSETTEMPLFLHFNNGWGMPGEKSSIVPADGTSLLRGSRRFFRCFVDLSKLPDFDEFGNNLVRYRESKGQCTRTHQGRKTFAEFCLKTSKSTLSPLSFHFGHLTEAITYSGYFQPIQRFGQELETMAYSASVDFLVSRAEGKPVFGKMAKEIERFLDDFGLKSIKDIKLLREKVEGIVVAHDLRIYFHVEGNCFISALPMRSRCQEADGGASWMFKRPNYMTRTVSMCGGCDCFLLDESHLPYWINREANWREAARDPTNFIAVKMHQQSRTVLRFFKKKSDGTFEACQ
jgi:hypothetical protein